MGAAGGGRKSGDDDVGPKLADNAHDIRQHLLAVPDAQGFVDVFGVAEIEGPRKKLVAAVKLPGGEEFPRTREAEFLAELGAALVLTAVAPRQGEVARAVAATPC